MFKFKKSTFTQLVIVVLLVILVGCNSTQGNQLGNQKNSSSASNSDVSSTAIETHIVTDGRGEKVTIPSQPRRIVDIAGVTEELLAIGLTPIASGNTDFNDPSSFTPILQDKLEPSTVNTGWYNSESNPEVIMSAQPDLILAGPPQAAIYEQLSQIAPTVLVPYNFSSFRERFQFVADVLDKKPEMEFWLKEYDTRAATLHDQIIASIPNESFAVIEATEKEIRIYSTTGVADIIFSDLQLPKAAGIPEPDQWGGKVTSIEALSTLNPDNIILMTASEQNVLKDSKVWGGLDAVKQGKVYQLTTRQNYNEAFTALGKQALLEQIASDILNKH